MSADERCRGGFEASIDTAEYRALEVAFLKAMHACEDDLTHETANAAAAAREAIIDHINERLVASKCEASTEPSAQPLSNPEQLAAGALTDDAKDARRYRQLFSIVNFQCNPLWPVVSWMRDDEDVSKEEIDAALDAAHDEDVAEIEAHTKAGSPDVA